MKGHIRKRVDAWELRVCVGVDADTGKKRYATKSIRGERLRGRRSRCGHRSRHDSRGGVRQPCWRQSRSSARQAAGSSLSRRSISTLATTTRPPTRSAASSPRCTSA